MARNELKFPIRKFIEFYPNFSILYACALPTLLLLPLLLLMCTHIKQKWNHHHPPCMTERIWRWRRSVGEHRNAKVSFLDEKYGWWCVKWCDLMRVILMERIQCNMMWCDVIWRDAQLCRFRTNDSQIVVYWLIFRTHTAPPMDIFALCAECLTYMHVISHFHHQPHHH